VDALTFWTAASGIGTVATAGVSLYLLRQGQRDRRQLREDQDRSQAELIAVSYTPGGDAAPVSADNWPGRFLTVHNNSNQPAYLLGVEFTDNPNGGEPGRTFLETISRQAPDGDTVILPGEAKDVPVPVSRSPEIGVLGDFAIVSFRDARGVEWRRRSDTLELDRPAWHSRLNLVQRFVEAADRAVPEKVSVIVNGWFYRRAFKAAQSRPDRVPFAVRLVKWFRGSWPVGDPDPWLLVPDGNVAWAYVQPEDPKPEVVV
jgi:hypothetical protein